MRNVIAILCTGLAFAAPATAQSSKPPQESDAPRSACAMLLPAGQAYPDGTDPFAGLPEQEIRDRLRREAPRRVRELDLVALMSCLTAEMNVQE